MDFPCPKCVDSGATASTGTIDLGTATPTTLFACAMCGFTKPLGPHFTPFQEVMLRAVKGAATSQEIAETTARWQMRWLVGEGISWMPKN